MNAAGLSWSRPEPAFVWTTRVVPADIDQYGHVNNTRYIAWAMECAWAHSHALGLSFSDYERIGAGYIVRRHEFDYLSAAMEGEVAAVATWIVFNDRRVRLTRAFEMREMATGRALAAGRTDLVCIDLKTGKPRRAPPEFNAAYEAITP